MGAWERERVADTFRGYARKYWERIALTLILAGVVGWQLVSDKSSPLDDEDNTGEPATGRGARVPEGFDVLDATPGPSGWAKKVKDPRSGVEFVLIPAGTFEMGSPSTEADRLGNEGPQHTVTISKPFYMAATEVTYAQWKRFVKASNYDHDPGGASDDHPQARVSWEDATAFCKHYGYRLPSEAEWEYACRAGTTTRYWSGDTDEDLARVGWYHENSRGDVQPVGRKPANPFGLYDMHGNVFEWCEDKWHYDYAGAPSDGSARREPPRGTAAPRPRAVLHGHRYRLHGSQRSVPDDSTTEDRRRDGDAGRLPTKHGSPGSALRRPRVSPVPPPVSAIVPAAR